MVIIDIKKDKKHQAALCFDSGEEILLDTDVFSHVSLHKGMDLSDDQLSQIQYLSEFLRAKSRALWYLDRCQYSEKGLCEKLIAAKFSKKVSAAVIKRLKELSLIDDTRYAKGLCEYLSENNVSKREIFHKMLQKGIPKDIITICLEETEIDESAQIRNIIEKKYKNKLSDRVSVDKVYAALCRKGFPFSVVREVINEYATEIRYSDGD
ncbi:MAG: regulatory protein RecX [Clostridia bacterium]|nr:regulatory protein RecX [Clostridia bacterium]